MDEVALLEDSEEVMMLVTALERVLGLLEDIGNLHEWQDWANEEMGRQQKRILELEGQNTDAKENYLESLIASANVEIGQQRKRIYELEGRLVGAKDVQNQM